MKTLLLLRHAKAARDSSSGADRDRPLNERGREDAPRMGKSARKMKIIPDQVLCSPALRTRQTLELFLDKLDEEVPVSYVEEIYLAEPTALLRLISKQESADCLLLVGHNPGLELLFGHLLGGPVRVHFPTCALAAIRFEVSQWSEIMDHAGELDWLIRPSVIDP